MQKKGFLKMIFLELRNRSAPLFLNPMENKKNLSVFSPFFFFLSKFFPLLIWSPLPLFKIFKIHPLSVCAFLFAPYCPGWNSGMTTKTKKSCSSGHAGLASCGRRLSTVPKTHISPFSFILSFSFGTPKAGFVSIRIKMQLFLS